MAQQIAKNKPYYVVTDKHPKLLTENEAVYLKNYRTTFNANAAKAQGGNEGMGTPNRSNKKYALITLPAGTNVTIGSYECQETNELYFANWNSNNLHGWYVIDAKTLSASIIVIDKELAFSIDPKHKMKQHRIHVRATYQRTDDNVRTLKEKSIDYTDGNQWQGYIDTMAAIGSNGFDEALYPYWKTRQPHFDRKEYFQLAVRPPMFAPLVNPVTPTIADQGKPNAVLNKSIQFAYKYSYTDGRPTTLSPYSLPVAQRESNCQANNFGIPRCYDIELNAGSPMVERIELYQRLCGGDWNLYDTIERFGPMQPGIPYWTRTGDWADFNYDQPNNTITYRYCGDRQLGIVPEEQAEFASFQTDLPLISIGQTAAGDAIILADNLYGYNNVIKAELNKFTASLIDDDESTAILQPRKITLYAYLAANGQLNQHIWINGADKTQRFGGITFAIPNPSNPVPQLNYDTTTADYFNLKLNDVGGFVVYLAGTDYFATSKQYFVNADGTMQEQDTIDIASQDQKDLVFNLYKNGGYVVHRFDLIVPPGKYIARMARHGVSTASEYQKTSTYLQGMASKSNLNGPHGLKNLLWDNKALDNINKELEIDVCNGDFDAWKQPTQNLFYIFIPYIFDTGGLIPNKRWRFIEGYVQEDEITQVPVEALRYDRGTDGGIIDYFRWGVLTDHNGFFFVYMAKGTAFKGEVVIQGVANCQSFKQIATTKIRLDSHQDRGYYPNENISLKDNLGSYGQCNRVLIEGQVIDNTTGLGYSGVAITSTRGGSTFTASDGTFILAVHDGINYQRKDRIYINSPSGAGCNILPATGNCMSVIPYDLSTASCTPCNQRIYGTNITIKVKVLNQAITGLKDGGSYTPEIHLLDLAGRSTFSQELNQLSIPTFMEKGGFILSKIKIDLLQDFNAPKDAAYLMIGRTPNQRTQKYLSWVGDKIDFLDKDGNVTLTGAGAIRARITIQSLLDYNVQNNFSTTATYQFTAGDILRFYDDGNGNFFDPKNGGLLDFPILGTDFAQTVQGTVSTATTTSGVTTTTTQPINSDGNTIIIGFDKRLLSLNGISATNDGTNNNLNACAFWIEIMTPKDTNQIDTACEVLGTWPIFNGVIPKQSFILNTFDTYYQTRNIHVSQCTGKAILHPFASASVSDYFGNNCSSCGRLLANNPLARQQWDANDAIKSDEIVNEGAINGFGRWRAKNRKQYKGQEFGGIVALHAQNKQVVFVCESDWFLTDYNMNFVQVTEGGLISATFSQLLGEPEQKDKYKFGCSFEDTGTITINDEDGVIFWADAKKQAIVIMDYHSAFDLSRIDNKGYFSDKFTWMRQYNENLNPADYLNNLIELNFGYDFKLKDLHISFRKRKGLNSDPQYFTNTERGKVTDLPETFTFGLEEKRWTGWQTFVPEFFGTIRKGMTGDLLITFAAGQPYLHNSEDVDSYNNFYGVQDTQVVELAFTIPGQDQYKRQIETPGKDLTFQAVTIESPVVKYFIDRVTTTNPNTFSYVPQAWFKRKKNTWYASLLRDMASYPDALHPTQSMLADGGGKISGKYVQIRFVRDLQKMDEYNEVDGFYCQFIGLEKSK